METTRTAESSMSERDSKLDPLDQSIAMIQRWFFAPMAIRWCGVRHVLSSSQWIGRYFFAI